MKWILLVSAVALAGQMAARAGAGADRADTSGGVVTLPSAAGRSEANTGVVVTLPAPSEGCPRAQGRASKTCRNHPATDSSSGPFH
jgi:hypothetical protein